MNYKLDNRPNKKKHQCPSCLKQRKFTRYIHIETHEELNDDVGICDRANNCGYHFTPKKYFEKNPQFNIDTKTTYKPIFQEVKPVSYIDVKYLHQSANCSYKNNNFVNHLIKLFGLELANILCKIYQVGNSNTKIGANVFWQIDINQKIRHGKIMLYEKERFNRIKFFHSVSKILYEKGLIKEFNLKQCFFGEHLLKFYLDMPVAIVESEKTAMVCYAYMPDKVWLACGSANGLNIEQFHVLKNRKIILYPDLKQYKNWSKKAEEIKQKLGLNIVVSSILEEKACLDDLNEGFDIADYILKTNSNGRAIYDNNNLIEYENYEYIYIRDNKTLQGISIDLSA